MKRYVLASGTAAVIAMAAMLGAQEGTPPGDGLSFQKATLDTILQAVQDRSGVPIRLERPEAGTIRLTAVLPWDKTGMLRALERLLEENGFAAVSDGSGGLRVIAFFREAAGDLQFTSRRLVVRVIDGGVRLSGDAGNTIVVEPGYEGMVVGAGIPRVTQALDPTATGAWRDMRRLGVNPALGRVPEGRIPLPSVRLRVVGRTEEGEASILEVALPPQRLTTPLGTAVADLPGVEPQRVVMEGGAAEFTIPVRIRFERK